MTYQSMLLQNDVQATQNLDPAIAFVASRDRHATFLEQILLNQSPIMKVWGILMIINLLVFLFLIQ